jgi:hypothetical protein
MIQGMFFCFEIFITLSQADHYLTVDASGDPVQVLVIAVLMRMIMRRTFSVLQWEALLLLCVGITINQLDHCRHHPYPLAVNAYFVDHCCTLEIGQEPLLVTGRDGLPPVAHKRNQKCKH